MNKILISTDMDGTLLGHSNYDYDAALPLIKKLNQLDIPIILNTSKTVAEIQNWQKKLGINHPAIVENGSAIFTPGKLSARDQASNEGENLHVFGAKMVELDAFLAKTSPKAINFLTCDNKMATALTGLEGPSLLAARSRQFSIPLQFSLKSNPEPFLLAAQARGLHCTKGGRFFSLQGQCDKGTTLKHLIHHYEQAWQSKVTIVALGDNHNDLSMLQTADIPVVVNTANGHQLAVANPASIYTTASAPSGWVEGVSKALAALSITL
jgi:mannosyl-3-phosphoglycerate phosphatase